MQVHGDAESPPLARPHPEEGVWTKHIDRNACWQSVDRMGREFREVANAIRRDKGLEPAMQGLAVA
jgi:hypothetical protein